MVVHFRILKKPKEDEFSLELSKLHTYDDVVERVSEHLGLNDPSKIKLTSHNCYSQQPKPQPIKYRGVEHLSDITFVKGVEPWSFEQNLGEAIFVPAGCPFQARNVQGLKTGMYYLRTRAASDAIKFTVDTSSLKEKPKVEEDDDTKMAH